MMEQWVSLGIDVQRVLHGEEAFEYLTPTSPGDSLTGVLHLACVIPHVRCNGSAFSHCPNHLSERLTGLRNKIEHESRDDSIIGG